LPGIYTAMLKDGNVARASGKFVISR